MRKRILGYGVWLILAACLFFFENNAGTGTVLASTLLLSLFPGIRHAFLRREENVGRESIAQAAATQTFSPQEEDEPGEVRSYLPGDPIGRIHWKLSAKKDELLIRESAKEEAALTVQAEIPIAAETAHGDRRRHSVAWMMAAILFISLLLLLLIPEANRSAQALLNRIFEASEQRNAYVYTRFPVDADQSVALAALLLLAATMALLSLTVFSGSRALALGMMAGGIAFQVYFGLPFPSWVNVLCFALFSLWVLARPWDRKKVITILALISAVSLIGMIFFPGENGTIEAASENVRDLLSRAAEQISGSIHETASGETETRHAHTQSLIAGNQEARPEKEYRLVTVEEEQISMPHWVDYLRIALLLLLTIALVILPFIPFLLLNQRRKQTEEARQAFQSGNVSEAVCAIFQHVIAWLEATENGAGNLPYVQWADHLAGDFPEDYDVNFTQCAEAFTEAAYSDHDLAEEKRQQALRLLEETEEWLLSRANWKEKLRLKYGKGLYA